LWTDLNVILLTEDILDWSRRLTVLREDNRAWRIGLVD